MAIIITIYNWNIVIYSAKMYKWACAKTVKCVQNVRTLSVEAEFMEQEVTSEVDR